MKLIYQSILLSVFICLTYQVNAQQEDKPANFWTKENTTDFRTIQETTEAYFEGRDQERGSGYKQWKRWEQWNQSRLTPDGQIFNHAAKNFTEYRKLMKDQDPNRMAALNTWEKWGANNYVAPASYSAGGTQTFSVLPGGGVINCIAFHPTDANTLFIGGPATGLWKTTNHGTSWTNLTDGFFSNVGISSIAVNYNNPNIMYILTGDGDGRNTYSTGIWKTTDGGNSWFPTSLIWSESEMHRGFKLAMNPINPDILLAATSEGLYRTTNGFTFDEVESGYFYDVVYEPGTQFTIYATTSNLIFRSQNAGIDFDFLLSIPGSERIQVAVSLTDPDMVYALGGGYAPSILIPVGGPGFPGLYVSKNGGDNWSIHSTSPAICSYESDGSDNDEQVPYDIDMAANPFDPSVVIMGAINVWGSADTGKVWTPRAQWDDPSPINKYVHSDIHAVEFNPLNGQLYITGDGGVYSSTDNGFTFTDITQSLDINQFFAFSGTPQNTDYMIAGLYHNGSREYTGTNNSPTLGGGDGVGCMIDHQDDQTIYYSSQNGSLRRSTNGGSTSTFIKPNPNGSGTFITQYAMDPTNSSIIYAGWKKDTIYKSIDKGTNWSFVEMPSVFLESRKDIVYVHVASNGTTVYACSDGAVFRSTNSGTNWSSIYSGGDGFTSVVPIPGAPDQAYITRGGYDDDDKIYLYNNGSITNISYNLPNIPAHITAYNPNPALPEIYLGTDVGVFKKNIVETSWTLFSTGMPNTVIKDLEFYPSASILRAATYGRGLWEVQLDCVGILTLTEANDPTNGNPKGRLEQANSTIFSSRKIQGSNGAATYNAGGAVILESGFLATEGNKVLIGTAGCGQSLE